LLGTLYPLLIDALGQGKISVGPPYFDAVFAPLMLPLLALLGFGPLAAWQSASPTELLRRLRWPLLASGLLGALLSIAFLHSLQAALALSLGLWVLFATGWHLAHALSQPGAGWQGLRLRWRQTPRATVGMWLAHAGLAVFVLGVCLVKTLEQSREASLKIGERLGLAGYEFVFEGLEKTQGPNYIAARATFSVSQQGRALAPLHPEKRFYTVQQMPMSEAAIDRGLFRDLYISLAEAVPGGAWGLRVQVKPFMSWIWIGCLLMAWGGGLAAADKRYRRKATRNAPVKLGVAGAVAR